MFLKREEIQKNPEIIVKLLSAMNLNNFLQSLSSTRKYTTRNVSESDYEDLFKIKVRKASVISIKEIFNPYTKLLFELNKLDTQIFDVSQLYHGTKYINEICKENFNYRYNGKSKGHKFGKGVYYSRSPCYASHYTLGSNKILYCDVSLSKSIVGNKNTSIPPSNCDATKNKNDTIIVKYHDDTFYPKYLVKYSRKEKQSAYSTWEDDEYDEEEEDSDEEEEDSDDSEFDSEYDSEFDSEYNSEFDSEYDSEFDSEYDSDD